MLFYYIGFDIILAGIIMRNCKKALLSRRNPNGCRCSVFGKTSRIKNKKFIGYLKRHLLGVFF